MCYITMKLTPTLKSVRWVGSSLDALREFPKVVRRNMGYALQFAQAATKHPAAKPLKGFKGAGVLEIVEDHRGDTYRAVYTVRLPRSSMCFMRFKRNPNRASRLRSTKLSSFTSDCELQSRTIRNGFAFSQRT